MAFIVTLDSVSMSGDPGFFDLDVTYTDGDSGWSLTRSLHLSVDPSLTQAQQLQAIRAAVVADGQKYKTQLAIRDRLLSLVSTSLTV